MTLSNALVPLVHNDNADVRAHAVLALGKMGLPKARTFCCISWRPKRAPSA